MSKQVPASLLTAATLGSYQKHDPRIMTPDAAVLWDFLLDHHKGYYLYPSWNLISALEPTELVRRWLVMDSLRPVVNLLVPKVHEYCMQWALNPTADNYHTCQNTETWGPVMTKIVTYRTPLIQYEWINLTGNDPSVEQQQTIRFRAQFFWWLDMCGLLPEPV